MKYLTVFILGLSAITVFAAEYDQCDSKVNVSLFTDEFAAAVKLYPLLPTNRYAENLVLKLKESFLKTFTDFSKGLQELTYHQAQEAGENLINNITEYRNNLENSIKSIKNKNSGCLDLHLRRIINQCNIFLSTIPGNALIKRPGLPELPSNQIEATSSLRKPSLSELFVNLADYIDRIRSDGYSYITGAYLVGWETARLEGNEVQNQYRNEILNIKAFPVYVEVIKDLYKQSEFIENHVKNKDIWKEFKVDGDRILSLYEDWVTSRRKENCPT